MELIILIDEESTGLLAEKYRSEYLGLREEYPKAEECVTALIKSMVENMIEDCKGKEIEKVLSVQRAELMQSKKITEIGVMEKQVLKTI